MSVPDLFNSKCERIKALTAEALSAADMFASFKHHRPTMEYYDAIAAARNLRAAADRIDEMAAKIAPAEAA